MSTSVQVPVEISALATKLYRIEDNKKFISTLNNNIRKWGVIDRSFVNYATQEKYFYYQANHFFVEKDYSF